MSGKFPAPWGVPSRGIWYPDTPLLAAECFICSVPFIAPTRSEIAPFPSRVAEVRIFGPALTALFLWKEQAGWQPLDKSKQRVVTIASFQLGALLCRAQFKLLRPDHWRST
jgi:hypothetical protein